jgi:hypothetical protein
VAETNTSKHNICEEFRNTSVKRTHYPQHSSLLWVVSTDTALLAWLHDKGLHTLGVANYPVLGCGILHQTRITVNLDPICKLGGSARDRATVLVTPDREFTIASSANAREFHIPRFLYLPLVAFGNYMNTVRLLHF